MTDLEECREFMSHEEYCQKTKDFSEVCGLCSLWSVDPVFSSEVTGNDGRPLTVGICGLETPIKPGDSIEFLNDLPGDAWKWSDDSPCEQFVSRGTEGAS